MSRPASPGCAVLRLQPDPIIDRVSEPLLAADVSVSRLDAFVAEKVLDLLDLPARVMAQAGAGPPAMPHAA
jgi:hypothetical protein